MLHRLATAVLRRAPKASTAMATTLSCALADTAVGRRPIKVAQGSSAQAHPPPNSARGPKGRGKPTNQSEACLPTNSPGYGAIKARPCRLQLGPSPTNPASLSSRTPTIGRVLSQIVLAVTTAWHTIGRRPRPAVHLPNVIATLGQNDRWKRLLYKHNAQLAHKYALYRTPNTATHKSNHCPLINQLHLHPLQFPSTPAPASPHFPPLTPKPDFPPCSPPLRRSGTSRPPPRRDRGSRSTTGHAATQAAMSCKPQSSASRLRSCLATERIAGVFALIERYLCLLG
jgi:hypothetical protein